MSTERRGGDGDDGNGVSDRFRSLFENIPAAAVEVVWDDGTYDVVEVNVAFEDAFGYDAPTVVGKPIADYVTPDDTDISDEIRRLREGELVRRTVERETATGPRTFEMSAIPIFGGERVLAVYSDVSEEQRRQRYQRVLTRVLRHTLRNEMNAISAHAETIAAQVDDPDLVESAETIHEAALDVAALDEKARIVETELEAAPGAGTTDVAKLVREVTNEVGREHGVAVEIALPETLPVQADSRLRHAVSNVMEDAADRGADRIRVAHDRDPERRRVDVRFVDDGEAVPEQVRAVITGETEPSQLAHSDGLALWIVKWVAEGRGGSVAFDDEALSLSLRSA
ncbi:PAS domain S-box protein [Halosegnis marinus]|uniref:histidine kinase n=1 Tax=Halosegnis marinus TaxID=3034023 RepID=A0ABD5ZK99_9EURY|nr:PAS domain S-box protein [Halosegnis sp. DT85]